MGAAVYLKLERPIAGLDHITAVDGKAVGNAWDSLNDFAISHGLTPLHDFLSTSAEDISALLGTDVLAQSAVEIPAEEWFEASSGAAAVAALLQAVQSNGFEASKDLLRDLHSYCEVLRAVAQEGSRFHFAFDF